MSSANLSTTDPLSRLGKAARDFLKGPKKLLIGGEWRDAVSGKTFAVIDPATGEEFAHVAEGDKEDIDLAVAAARKAFQDPAWRYMKPSEREKLMHRFANLIEQHAEELSELEALDAGKSIIMARYVDIALAADCFRYMAGWPTKMEGSVIPLSVPFLPDGTRTFSYSVREPVGVVGQIIPWNFPALMAAWKLAPALATGCTVILKPAEETPLTALRLGELAMEAGYPAGVINIIPGYGHTAGAALSNHPDVDKIAFTGSTEVGKLITRAAVGNLKKVSLELGGKSPVIIMADADMEKAIPGAANAIFFHQGQVCAAGSRLYIHSSVHDQVIEGMVKIAKGMKVGHGLDPSTQMGPLVSQVQIERVCGYIESGISEGAEAATGGKRIGNQGYFVEPTIMVNANHKMKIVKEEIFGPVVAAMSFSDTDELAAMANDSVYGLSASVWTQDISKVHTLVPQIQAGTVWVNCHAILDSAMPFGGYKQSGWGRELGKAALDLYTESKSVCIMV
jgi:phenylacetaldehyde dehydrogenase